MKYPLLLNPILLACLLAGCSTPPSARYETDAFSCRTLPPAILQETEEEDDAATATASAPPMHAEPIALDVQESVLMALQQNTSFRVDRLEPGIMETYERQERATFDPVLSGNLYRTDLYDSTNNVADRDTLGAEVALKEFLPYGTTIDLGAARTSADAVTPSSESYDVKVTQALLRGLGTGVNLARLRQARIDTQISAYELRGIAESLVARVERAYWDCILSERSIAIYEKSLDIAEQEIAEAEERIRLGKLAETELAAVEAELASRRENLIDARSSLAKNRLLLLRLIRPAGGDPFERVIVLTQSPDLDAPVVLDDVKAHVALGLKQRADLNQARLSVERGDIEIVRTRNGMLPKLDLFFRLGGTRYAESFASKESDEWGSEVQAGVSLEYPLGNRAERAAYERSLLSLARAEGALANMRELVEVDIRTAYLEVERTEEQLKATEATRKLRDETLKTEMEKLRVGKSTSLMVAEASRNLVESEIACTRTVIAYRKAILDLYRLEGSLLDRRGIQSVVEVTGE